MPVPSLLDLSLWMASPGPPGPPEAEVFTPAFVDRALGGDRAAQRRLFDALLPHVQKKVNAVLYRRASAGGKRPIRQEVLDATQDVFVALFEHDARALRAWRPELGASLPTWVGRIAEKRIISALRTAKHNPWTETPSEARTFERLSPSLPSAHAQVADRQQLERILDALQAELSDQAFQLFVALIVEEREVAWVCDAFDMTANAVYIWRSRLKQTAREILGRLATPPDDSPREPRKDPPTTARKGG